MDRVLSIENGIHTVVQFVSFVGNGLRQQKPDKCDHSANASINQKADKTIIFLTDFN